MDSGLTEGQEDILAVMKEWGKAVSSGNADQVVALYDPDVAAMWGTFSPYRRDTPESIRECFTAFLSRTELKVTFYHPYIRVLGDTAINTGYYTFAWREEGRSKVLLARFSFVYARREGRWLIVDHHSSQVPTPP